ncbi:hypothetical protein B9Z44_07080 [Limnohabitans curvus]|uniref:Uncharacterized protein n=1 Tax=Limnohabitans curvus TaxID=323423 RepID=A0A315EQ44_9BURK|nr:hypothetical protein B9Z44_07080 [Limnohabitans curvus]
MSNRCHFQTSQNPNTFAKQKNDQLENSAKTLLRTGVRLADTTALENRQLFLKVRIIQTISMDNEALMDFAHIKRHLSGY